MAEKDVPLVPIGDAATPASVAAPVADAAAAASNVADDRDEVTAWIQDEELKEPAVTLDAAKEEPKAEAAPTPETPPSTATPESAPKADAAPTSETPAAKPEAAPRSYDLGEKIGLRDGVEWTREQILVALQERAASAPLAQEAEQYRSLFGTQTYAEAEQAWKPILERLRSDATLTQHVDSILAADPAKLDYLVRSAEYYDSQAGAPAAAPAAAAVPAKAVESPEIAELRKFVDQARKQAAQQRTSTEWSAATARYPFLNNDLAARQALLTLAQALYNEDRAKGVEDMECRGITDAVKMNEALYDAKMIALNRAASDAGTTPAVPPVLGSLGAAPSGARASKPKAERNVDLDSAAAEWLASESAKFE